MCDQISDAELDAHLKVDPDAKVACGLDVWSCHRRKRGVHALTYPVCPPAERQAEVSGEGWHSALEMGKHRLVTMEYREVGSAVELICAQTFVLLAHHAPGELLKQMQKELMNRAVKEVIPAEYLDERTVHHLLPSKAFLESGPKLSYAIGLSHPLAISAFHVGKSDTSEDELIEIIEKNCDLCLGPIIGELDLKRPIDQWTACHGHFGREEFTWEQPKRLVY